MTDHWHFRWASAAQPLFVDATSAAASTSTVGGWLSQLAACRAAVASISGQRVLLYLDDTTEFSLWLFALLQAGKTVVLAPNGLPETLAQAMLHADTQLLADALPALPSLNDDASRFLNLDVNKAHTSLPLSAKLVFFTSGSSGQPKLVTKDLWQLQTEIQLLQQTFTGLAAHTNMLVASTVPHQHIYGLLFRVLWPLSAGWTLLRPTVHFAEQWLALSQPTLDQQTQPVMLISSPAQLSRYDDVTLVQQSPAQFAAVFSSGGPLATADAVRFYQQSGLAITEIYGSTETGGIGYRQQQTTNTSCVWQAFAGIQLAQDEQGCLLLRSPYLAKQDLSKQEWFATTDMVTLHTADQFSLAGRVDRIVKLAEKRLSLAEVENLCGSLSFVHQAVALILPGSAGHGREQLALVVELTDAGQQLLATAGKHAINQHIKRALASRFETVLLPRRFRYVQSMPYNAQGKLPRQQLELLFLS